MSPTEIGRAIAVVLKRTNNDAWARTWSNWVSMPRVYHFLLDHRIGGPHVYVDTIRRALGGRFESTVVTTGRGPMTEFALLNLRHIWFPLYAIEVPANVLVLLGAIIFGRIVRDGAVFHVHGAANIAPLVAARLAGVPVIWQMHETTPMFARFVKWGRRLLGGTRHSLAVVAKKSADVYGLADAALLPAAVDSTFWSVEAVSEADRVACGWRQAQDKVRPLRLLAVGNLNPLKGMDVLIEALRELDGPWHLKIVGAELATHRSFAESLYQSAHALIESHCDSRIDFLGWQDKRKVRALLAECDMFVLPSRSEACPIALLEALAMGCCCVAADVGDVRMMLAGTDNCAVVEADSASACRHAIESLRSKCMTRQTGRPAIGAAWQMDHVIADTEATYRRLLRLS